MILRILLLVITFLTSYYWEVKIDGTEEEMDTEETQSGEADTCVELVDLTNVYFT